MENALAPAVCSCRLLLPSAPAVCPCRLPLPPAPATCSSLILLPSPPAASSCRLLLPSAPVRSQPLGLLLHESHVPRSPVVHIVRWSAPAHRRIVRGPVDREPQ